MSQMTESTSNEARPQPCDQTILVIPDATNEARVGSRELRVLRDADGISTIQLARSQGPVELEIVIGPQGPVVRVRAAQIELVSDGAMALACEDFSLHARGSIELRADGDLSHFIAGDLQSVAAGEMRLDAKGLRVRARQGQVRIEASDNVRIDGERVLLNS